MRSNNNIGLNKEFASRLETGSIEMEMVSCFLCGSPESELIAIGRDYDYDTSDMQFTFVACSTCGHIYLNPRPKLESADKIYPRNYYTVSGEHKSGAFSLLGKVKDFIVKKRIIKLIEHLKENANVLDVGCGDGALLLSIAKARPDLKLIGLDIQFNQETRKDLESKGIECIEEPFEKCVLAKKCGLILMNQLIEHLWDVKKALSKIGQLLTDNGVVSISTPNSKGYDFRFFKKNCWGGYYFPRHLNVFSSDSLKQLLEDMGFAVVKQSSLVAPLIWMSTARAIWKKNRYPGVFLFCDSNLLLLAVFTAVDLIAAAFRCETSNQQIIARFNQADRQRASAGAL